MYITKQGVIPPEQNYEATCGNCKTEFEFIESEGSWVCGNDEESTLSVKCPLCGKYLGLTVNHSEADFQKSLDDGLNGEVFTPNLPEHLR